MVKKQFIQFLLITMFEAWFFADALLNGRIFFAAIWSFLLYGRLRTSYRLDRAVEKAGLV
ncbi:DUF3272 family protein [Streptococcaceae bacterium ESL0729]|nr:DUF3272 family protein [Streptococcaceae bacterium ESL0729]